MLQNNIDVCVLPQTPHQRVKNFLASPSVKIHQIDESFCFQSHDIRNLIPHWRFLSSIHPCSNVFVFVFVFVFAIVFAIVFVFVSVLCTIAFSIEASVVSQSESESESESGQV